MNTNEIQKRLAEQRKLSKIFKATNHEIAMQINNHLKGDEVHEKKSLTMKEKYSNPEYLERHTLQQQFIAQTDDWKAAHAEGIKKRTENGWVEKNANAAKKRCKPIQTPLGRFESKGAAVKAMTAAGEINAGGKLSVWLDTKKDEYYYIDK